MLRILTAGESHGPKLTLILEGMPAGLPISGEQIQTQLARRQQGYGAGERMKIESDTVRITAGVLQGMTTGGPIALEIDNRDFSNWQGKTLSPMTIPRPGHADLPGAIKYGYSDLRIASERSSARETAVRVAAGAICQTFLSSFEISIGGYVVQIGTVICDVEAMPIAQRIQQAQTSPVKCPDAEASQAMQAAIDQAAAAGDSLGGVMEVVACNVPPGLGTFAHYDRRLDAKLAFALMGIPAIKGVSIGNAFANVTKLGSQVNDPIMVADNGELQRASNHAGGIEGGMSNGKPIVVRAALKPIPTFPQGLPSVNLATGQPQQSPYHRSDTCPVARAVPVVEAMVAIVLADLMLEKLGGDSMEEILPRFAQLRKANIQHLHISPQEWRWEYR